MDKTIAYILGITCLVLYIGAAVLLAWGFVRSRKAVLLLLFVVLIVWPVIESTFDILWLHFTEELAQGKKPWLFPYSLMVQDEQPPYSAWKMRSVELKIVGTRLLKVSEAVLVAVCAGMLFVSHGVNGRTERRYALPDCHDTHL